MAMGNVREVDERIKAIVGEVTALSRVYETVPRTIASADLPSAMVIPKAQTRSRASASDVTQIRNWRIEVYFSKFESGISGEKETSFYNIDLIDEINDIFDSRPRLEKAPDKGIVTKAFMTGDTGLSQIEFPQGSGQFYLGVVFTLQVETLFKTVMRR